MQPGREKLLAPPPLFEGWGSDKQSTIGGLPKIDPPKPGREKVPVPPPPVKGFDGGAKNGETGGLAAILVIEADCQTLLNYTEVTYNSPKTKDFSEGRVWAAGITADVMKELTENQKYKAAGAPKKNSFLFLFSSKDGVHGFDTR